MLATQRCLVGPVRSVTFDKVILPVRPGTVLNMQIIPSEDGHLASEEVPRQFG